MKCEGCGSPIAAEQLHRGDCPFCGCVLPHRARAAEKVAVLKELTADRNQDGIPDSVEGLMGSNARVDVRSGGGGFTATSHSTSSQVVMINGRPVSTSEGGIPPSIARLVEDVSKGALGRNHDARRKGAAWVVFFAIFVTVCVLAITLVSVLLVR